MSFIQHTELVIMFTVNEWNNWLFKNKNTFILSLQLLWTFKETLLCHKLLKCNNDSWIESHALSSFFNYWKLLLWSDFQFKSYYQPIYVYFWVFVCHVCFNVINSPFSLYCIFPCKFCCDQNKHHFIMYAKIYLSLIILPH